MTRVLVGFLLLPFVVPALLWALARLVNWPAAPQHDRDALYRKRAARLRALAARASRGLRHGHITELLVIDGDGREHRFVFDESGTISEAREAVELFLALVHVRWYAITHRCSREQACAEINDAELKELLP